MVKTFSNQLKTKDKRINTMREEIKMLHNEHANLNKEISMLKMELEMPTPGGRYHRALQSVSSSISPSKERSPDDHRSNASSQNRRNLALSK